MDINTLKIYGVNAAGFIASLAEIDAVVKVLIGIAVFGYTVLKGLNEYKKWRSKDSN